MGPCGRGYPPDPIKTVTRFLRITIVGRGQIPAGAAGGRYVRIIIIYVGYEYWIYKYKHIWRVGLGVGVTAACFDRRWESPSAVAAGQALSPHGQHRALPEVRGPAREGRGSAEPVLLREAMSWVLHGRWATLGSRVAGYCRWAVPEVVTGDPTRC